MALNDDIDTVIAGLPAHASSNAITELEALQVAAVRLAKRYAKQKSLPERDVLAHLIGRLQSRAVALADAQFRAEAQVVAANSTAVATALAAIPVEE